MLGAQPLISYNRAAYFYNRTNSLSPCFAFRLSFFLFPCFTILKQKKIAEVNAHTYMETSNALLTLFWSIRNAIKQG